MIDYKKEIVELINSQHETRYEGTKGICEHCKKKYKESENSKEIHATLLKDGKPTRATFYFCSRACALMFSERCKKELSYPIDVYELGTE